MFTLRRIFAKLFDKPLPQPPEPDRAEKAISAAEAFIEFSAAKNRATIETEEAKKNNYKSLE